MNALLRLGIVVCGILVVNAPAAERPTAGRWRAGAAQVAITPTEPIWMAGFASRTRPSAGTRMDIHAKALALEDEAGNKAVIVTLDLVMIDRRMAAVIAERCRTQFGLNREWLVLNVSHTHSGPVAGLELMPLYELSPAQREVVARYTEAAIEKTVDVVGRAIANLQPAAVRFGQGLAGIAVNRRRVAKRDLPGPVDHDVPVLRIEGAAGQLIAVVAGYACHATALNDYLISGDWPGFAMDEVQRNHAGSVALFIQGCGADANPLPRGDEAQARSYGHTYAVAVEQVLKTTMTPLRGPMQAAFTVAELPFHQLPTRAELERRLRDPAVAVQRQARHLLTVLEREGRLPPACPYPVQVWQVGPALRFIALGGEVVVDYSLRLKSRYGFAQTWVAGYSNDIPGYIPSQRVLAEGGYEGGDAMVYFGQPGRFADGVEEIIVAAVDTLVRRLEAEAGTKQ